MLMLLLIFSFFLPNKLHRAALFLAMKGKQHIEMNPKAKRSMHAACVLYSYTTIEISQLFAPCLLYSHLLQSELLCVCVCLFESIIAHVFVYFNVYWHVAVHIYICMCIVWRKKHTRGPKLSSSPPIDVSCVGIVCVWCCHREKKQQIKKCIWTQRRWSGNESDMGAKKKYYSKL